MHLFPSAFLRILKHELIIEELYRVLLEVTAWSGQVHLKLTSGAGNFSLNCKGEQFDCWCTNVPTDPCSAGGLITWFLHHPLLSPFSYGRQAWERSVWFCFHSRDYDFLPQCSQNPVFRHCSLPLGYPCCRQLSPQTM